MSKKEPEVILCEVDIPNEKGLLSYSPFCEKINRALRYAQIPYTRRHGKYPGEFKHFNPLGKVPVLLVDGSPICDSTRILHWILEHRPQRFHEGWSPKQIAEAWLWEEFADTTLNGFVIASRWADERNWPNLRKAFFGGMPLPLRFLLPGTLRKGVMKALKAREVWSGNPDDCWRRYQELLTQLEDKAPTQGYWCGETLSVADISIFSQLNALRSKLTPWQRNTLESHTALCDYLERVNKATTPTQDIAQAA